MPALEVNGTKLEYVERGSGPAVVFVHGVLNDLRSWEKQLDAFASRYRTVAFSCRHHHPNEPIEDGAALPLRVLTDDLEVLLRRLNLAPAHLVGASSGGFACLMLAHARPELVRTLVLVEAPVLSLLGVSVPPRPHEILRLLVRSPATALAVIKLGARGIGPARRAFDRGDDDVGVQHFVRAMLGREAAANMSAAMRQQCDDNTRVFKARLRAGFPSFGEVEARAVSLPTLLVTGEHSAPILHRVTDALERQLPRAERLEMRGASHLAYDDDPAAFNAGVLAFLDRHRES